MYLDSLHMYLILFIYSLRSDLDTSFPLCLQHLMGDIRQYSVIWRIGDSQRSLDFFRMSTICLNCLIILSITENKGRKTNNLDHKAIPFVISHSNKQASFFKKCKYLYFLYLYLGDMLKLSATVFSYSDL